MARVREVSLQDGVREKRLAGWLTKHKPKVQAAFIHRLRTDLK